MGYVVVDVEADDPIPAEIQNTLPFSYWQFHWPYLAGVSADSGMRVG